MQQTNKAPYATLCTKLALTDKYKIKKIAEKFGLSFYELFQSLLVAIVRYFDAPTSISQDHYLMIDAFMNVLEATGKSFSLLNLRNKASAHVTKAIVFVEKDKAKAPQLLLVGTNDNGEITDCYNYDTMLEMMLKAIDPALLYTIQKEKEYNGYFSTLHALKCLVANNSISSDEIMRLEIEEMFSDQRTESGIATSEDVYYKQKKNPTDGNFNGQTQEKTALAEF